MKRMNGSDKVAGTCHTSNAVNLPKRSVLDMLAAEQALTYEERVRKAVNLKPYLAYLNDLFTTSRLSDSSDSDEAGEAIGNQAQVGTQFKTEDNSKSGITEAIHTLNLSLAENLSPSPATYLGQAVVKIEAASEGLPSFPLASAAPFSPSSSYSSSLPGLSPELCDSEKQGSHASGELPLPPISDLELHKYLEKPVHGLSSSADEYIISLLDSPSTDFKPKRMKWDHPKSDISSESKQISSPSTCSDLSIPKGFASDRTDLNPDDALLAGIGIGARDIKETTLKIKEDPDRLLTESFDFRDCMKSSSTNEKLNLNQTAREEVEEGVDGGESKRTDGIDDEDNDSLSDYMNITANSALALDTYFKFDGEDLTPASQSPISPSAAHILPSLAAAGQVSTAGMEDNSAMIDNEMSINAEAFSHKTALQKQARMVQILNMKRRKIYILVCKKEVVKAARLRSIMHNEMLSQTKRLAQMCSRHLYQEAVQSQKMMKDSAWRAKRLTREIQGLWKQNDRAEREKQRWKERAAEQQRRMDKALSYIKEQQHQLKVVILGMEGFSYLVSKKLNGNPVSASDEELLKKLNAQKIVLKTDPAYGGSAQAPITPVSQVIETAFELQAKRIEEYRVDQLSHTCQGSKQLAQTKVFTGSLKPFQQEGLDWLINLYENGVNGVLEDEHGLGKTVQALAFLAHLAESKGIWGPFLIIASEDVHSKLQQEFKKFIPDFVVSVYTGNAPERKALKESKYLSGKINAGQDVDFHAMITSFQISVFDLKYLDRVKWQYLIVDEFRGLSSYANWRSWKGLISLNCRNRVFLAESEISSVNRLCNLMHFVMPSLFCSDEELRAWNFSNVESCLGSKQFIEDEDFITLKEILKKFTLRRRKMEVSNAFPEKVEIIVPCRLSYRQKCLFHAIKEKAKTGFIPSACLESPTRREIHRLVVFMGKFRDVCNHPNIFLKRAVKSPFYMKKILTFYPRLLFREGFLYQISLAKSHLFENLLNIYNPAYIHSSLFGRKKRFSVEDLGVVPQPSTWSFTRLLGMTPDEIFKFTNEGDCYRWTYLWKTYQLWESLYRERLWKEPCGRQRAHDIILYPDLVTSFPSIQSSILLKSLVFTSPAVPAYTFQQFKICESSNQEREILTPTPVYLPPFLYEIIPKVIGGGRSFTWRKAPEKVLNIEALSLLKTGNVKFRPRLNFEAPESGGLEAVRPHIGWSRVVFPSKDSFVKDSGKLVELDKILEKEKLNNSRVLIFSHMSSMLRILEDFMVYRNRSYACIGANKDSMRKVSESDESVFIASTQDLLFEMDFLTLDTVVFYDSSDWDFSIDRKAFDRVYGLGRTKKLTIYRLLCLGTFEYRLFKRANPKMHEEEYNWTPSRVPPAELLDLIMEDDEPFEGNFSSQDIELAPVGLTKISISNPQRKARMDMYNNYFRELAKKAKISDVEPSSSMCSPASIAESSPDSSELNVEMKEKELMGDNIDMADPNDAMEAPSQDIDCVDGPSPSSKRSTPVGVDWATGSTSDNDEDPSATVSSRPKTGRGGGRRGRPPTRVRVFLRDEDGSRRGRPVGRPRLKRIGPLNQGVRGRKPGRPKTRHLEPSDSSSIPVSPSENIFGLHESPGSDPV